VKGNDTGLILKHYPSICLDVLRRTVDIIRTVGVLVKIRTHDFLLSNQKRTARAEFLSQNRYCTSRDANRAFPEYGSKAFP
jgi:hypothetical protein